MNVVYWCRSFLIEELYRRLGMRYLYRLFLSLSHYLSQRLCSLKLRIGLVLLMSE